MSKKAILIIMDGWGLGKNKHADAIQQANVPFVTSLYNQYPHTTLVTCGEAVGLPDGQMGNSEVGHLNLGAGRIVYQELQRINVAIRDGSFAKNAHLLAAISKAKNAQKPLHLLGLVSDGGVHSHISHLKAICNVCKENGLKEVYIHAFTDGRDCDPKSGLGFMQDLQQFLTTSVGKIATVSGRYYAMDRDKRWERIQLAYNAMVMGTGNTANSAVHAIEQSYAADITDEFIKPTVIFENDKPVATIQDGDVAICFNFRTDRCREITDVLTQNDHPDFNMHALKIDYTTMTEYDKTFHNVHIIFENDNLNNTLGEVLAAAGKKQIRIAETEKYPHVTFFFSGGREVPFEGESRIMVPSPKVATYDLKPEMSAVELTDKLIPEIEKGDTDFICLNYANADMVGHTGVLSAVIKAVETVDACVKRVVEAALKQDYIIFLTADHGNADNMINEDGTPNTQHSLNLVPLFVIDNNWHGNLHPGKLGDIAPTILKMMQLPIPKEMTGNILID
ncbi:MAG: 2,3-bisphosphoglycerate-independent phosphoglycerate mutase [Hydrotalea flava]|uniref:2,3-bisphosphoglycerate-independent phosphoglycerate mutase n=1 Tax=Hydrotalea TaxID=1004300 RepID=UPI001024D0E0|nr:MULTISPECIES: 2,3-bisphosphoglycerate-independent phosphoglycerate mutase [Hydrotalea]MBY0348699.1 2,3-bisphosphoglycerate-independent phosphoglycerate mutase [Hydrotalea flava]NIM34541.1 2,3-bisphosphoglycerate-independent phosphoglycerate mutase [Hydrotalea flava]NIM37381.1 2,3-bisphosphoglycerate-independent phosphoglycerate mutase [Hydrotalea flava]NIN02566.1 2,3-bisphosphoglycerate-independent phosphoglycerate mutase [Hydrotalea flava]NIN14226.1 2,3-bisphosphoglycerate-independent phos